MHRLDSMTLGLKILDHSHFIFFAGVPTYVPGSKIFLTTVAPAPTITFEHTSILSMIEAPVPIHTTFPIFVFPEMVTPGAM